MIASTADFRSKNVTETGIRLLSRVILIMLAVTHVFNEIADGIAYFKFKRPYKMVQPAKRVCTQKKGLEFKRPNLIILIKVEQIKHVCCYVGDAVIRNG